VSAGRPTVRRARREAHVERTYGVGPEALRALEEYQGGRCWGCRRATGRSRALAMDHNHRTGEARMLLCSTCNRIVVGWQARDDAVALIRLGMALLDPPSRSAWLADGAVHPGWEDDSAEAEDWLNQHLDLEF
jgi:hypothetical protein